MLETLFGEAMDSGLLAVRPFEPESPLHLENFCEIGSPLTRNAAHSALSRQGRGHGTEYAACLPSPLRGEGGAERRVRVKAVLRRSRQWSGLYAPCAWEGSHA